MTPADPEEFIRAAYAAFNAGEKIPTTEWWHEDGEYAAAREDPDSSTHVGLEAVQAQYERWVESYPDLQAEPLEVRVGKGGRVFAWVRMFGTGAESGLPLEMNLAQIWTLRDGKIARADEYFDRDEGLAAARLA
jgi:ketosteroid isomerase-like protein